MDHGDLGEKHVGNEPENAEDEKQDVNNAEDEKQDVDNAECKEIITEVSLPLRPKVLITSSPYPKKTTLITMKELGTLFDNCVINRRKSKNKIEDIAERALKDGFTSVIYLNESNKKINALAIINLASKMTAYFRFSSYVPRKSIKNHAKLEYPGEYEIISKNFTTEIGQATESMLWSIFPKIPNLQVRQVVVLQNNKDFIFFRLYRYIFETKDKCGLQEIGPRFTLKLMWLKNGIFNSRSGNYIYKYKSGSDIKKDSLVI